MNAHQEPLAPAAAIAASTNGIQLSHEERSWLAEHPVVRVAPDPDFPPVEFLDGSGGYYGIAADFIRFFERRLPLRFEIVELENWDACLSQARSREIDMLGAAVPTPDRLQYLRFTKPFVQFPAVVLVREGHDVQPTVRNMKGLKVGVVSGYAGHEFMVDRHPEADLEVMPDIASGLREVSFGRVDAMVLNLASASYYIEKEGITNLRVYRDTDFQYDLSFATRSDWPLLNSILQKAVDSLTEEESRALTAPWISLRGQAWRPSTEFLVGLTVVAAAAVLLGVLLWNRALRRLVFQRTEELQRELADRQQAERDKEALQQTVHRAKKMEALGLLAGGVAHDLNNILSGVVSYPELLLLRLPPDSPLRDQVVKIRQSGERAAAVVADLLTIARDAATAKELADLNELLRGHLDTPEISHLLATYPAMELHLKLEPDLLRVACSPVHLKKVLYNLLANAAEALLAGSGRVELSTANCHLALPLGGYDRVEPGEYVRLSVSDTGSGIAPEDLDRIFEPFFSKKELGRSGTGLGLAVVWNTVQDHGGYLDVRSDAAGTRFDLYLPATHGEQTVAADTVGLSHLRGNGESVLVVDDEATQREIASTMLETLGYRASSASSGDEALEMLRTEPVDLLLLDMIMDPGLDGRQTYAAALQIRPGQRAVIASGFAETDAVWESQALGAGRFLRKPYKLAQLAEAVREALGTQS